MARRTQANRGGNDGEQSAADPDRGNGLAAHVRERHRAVAEREAERLARPERPSRRVLAHANRKLSAVSSTPSGVFGSLSRPRPSDEDNEEDEEQWCGPFSVARQMIARREAAKRKREEELDGQAEDQARHPLDALMAEAEDKQRRRMHPSMQWKTKLLPDAGAATTSEYEKRKRRVELSRSGRSRVPSLFEIAVGFIADHFEHVESLGVVENEIRVALSRELVGRGRLDARAFEALVEPVTMETLEVVDCAGIPQESMASALASIGGLRYLLLTHAGRCFGKKAVEALLEKNKGAELCCLSLAGAYLLRDDDAARLLRAHAGTLQSIAFRSCPLLGGGVLGAIRTAPGLGENLRELSLRDLSLSGDQLSALAERGGCLQNLENLVLWSVSGLTDGVLSGILEAAKGSLRSLDIGYNHELGDATLSAIRRHNSPNLRTLVLDGIKGVTGAGLEALFTHPLEGLPAPPRLRVLGLSSIDHEAVTDELLRLATAGYSSAPWNRGEQDDDDDKGPCLPPGCGTYRGESFARRTGAGLVRLDVQGSTLVTDELLEHVVETSANTLEAINVSYCPLVGDRGLGYLVSRAGSQLKRIEVWGCAQLTDEFFDGHDRVRDGTLEIIGAWMKKSGTRSLR
ncbi:unnamed protein product [Pseudo-nitzschia multistriata]|uniref:Uncharacterized protein n=1 Tax=Pseudo-nitzschia multistriata TaxID=183589 RepID=A0A448ZP11_9STRA|nr:unnamed protein product [Pseudo-nitzschia multistriata]